MSDPTETFFARLAERGHEPALQRTSGSLRIDLDRDGRESIGHLELLDIPGRWGRLDAFGRGRVHVEDWHRGHGHTGRRSR